MRHVLLAAPLLAVALLSGCQALGFGDDVDDGGSGGADESNGGGQGASAGAPGGGYTLGVGEPPPVDPIDPGNQLNVGEPLLLCEGDWPLVTRAPRSHTGGASAQYARFLLLGTDKRLPEPALLRVEDFLAYYGDREPLDGNTVDAHFVATGVDTGSGLPGYVEVRVRPDVASSTAKHFVIVLDVSPSMREAMSADSPRVQEILGAIGTTLSDTDDEVSLVTFAGAAEVAFDRAVGADAFAALGEAASSLSVRTGNDLEGALKVALTVAKGSNDDDTTPTELVVLTDGGSDVAPALVPTLEQFRDEGVRTSVVQLSKGTRSASNAVIHDRFLDELATAGGGTRLFIADAAEATLAFEERFDETFRTALTDVTLSVTLPSGFVSLEDATGQGALSRGTAIVPGRWHSFRHRVSACAATLAAAGSNAAYVVRVAVHAAEVPDGVPVEIFYDGEFLVSSVGGLVEDAIIETVQHLRSGGKELTEKETTRLDAAWDRAGCASTGSATCATLSELRQLMIEASALR